MPGGTVNHCQEVLALQSSDFFLNCARVLGEKKLLYLEDPHKIIKFAVSFGGAYDNEDIRSALSGDCQAPQ